MCYKDTSLHVFWQCPIIEAMCSCATFGYVNTLVFLGKPEYVAYKVDLDIPQYVSLSKVISWYFDSEDTVSTSPTKTHLEWMDSWSTPTVSIFKKYFYKVANCFHSVKMMDYCIVQKKINEQMEYQPSIH